MNDTTLIPPTEQRVAMNTSDEVNLEIMLQTLQNVARYDGAETEAIDERLRELEREWDVERVLEMNASALMTAGAVLALTVNRKWAWLSAVVGTFLFQHAIQGWCPPLPMLRRLGVRTTREINIERIALKMLRGDFGAKTTPSEAMRRASLA